MLGLNFITRMWNPSMRRQQNTNPVIADHGDVNDESDISKDTALKCKTSSAIKAYGDTAVAFPFSRLEIVKFLDCLYKIHFNF